MVANTWLEGTYSERYPTSRETARHAAPVPAVLLPGASQATQRQRRPDRSTRAASSGTRWHTLRCASTTQPAGRLRDRRREAETGTLATSWHANKFANAARDGAVLPICT